MKSFLLCALCICIYSCKNSNPAHHPSQDIKVDAATTVLPDIADFKVLDSKVINNDQLWRPFEKELSGFTEKDYKKLSPLILEQNIPTLQQHVKDGKLSYELLVKYYLYRIRKYDRNNALALNAVISLNPDVIFEARKKDQELHNKMKKHPIFGMPILLKDNINSSGMPTTAGAIAFQNNNAEDAFIVERIKEQGALILGKANLSEWAYFFCTNCPSGYSAVGGQTLNPYGRKTMDTGGSSSGSGVAVAANFSVAAVGTETSGSILSPASQNSGVGLKPTVGLLSRSGIVPISSTLDTPGPMAKNVIDTAILLDALIGYDASDVKSRNMGNPKSYYESLKNSENNLKGKRFGVFKSMATDSLYQKALSELNAEGAILIDIEESQVDLPGFLRLLNLDMKRDFAAYVKDFGDATLAVGSIEDIITFNQKDSIHRMPYGQALLRGVVKDEANSEEFQALKDSLKYNGRLFFDKPMQQQQLDGIVSKNNVHAGYAAVAEYPAITVSMGYDSTEKPEGLTLIGKPYSEIQLLQWAYAYEQTSKHRKMPKNYADSSNKIK